MAAGIIETFGIKIGAEVDATGFNQALEVFKTLEESLTRLSSFITDNTIMAFSSFEDSLTAVKKTANLSGEEMTKMADSLIKISNSTGQAVEGLAEIAGVGGQLGVPKEQLVEFTKVVNEMAVSFDMTAEATATAAAKIAAGFQLDTSEANLRRLGDVINTLSDTTAASVGELLAFGNQFGSTASQMGITLEQAMALGTHLIAIGQDASDASTRLSAAFRSMGQKMTEAADMAGMSETAFKKLADEDMLGAFSKVVIGLGKIQSNTERLQAATEIFGAVGAKSVLPFIGNLDKVNQNLKNAQDRISPISVEFEAVMNRISNKLSIVGQNIKNFGIQIGLSMGETITPVLEMMGNFLQNIGSKLSKDVYNNLANISLAMAGIASSVAGMAGLAVSLGSLYFFAEKLEKSMAGIKLAFVAISQPLLLAGLIYGLVKSAEAAEIFGHNLDGSKKTLLSMTGDFLLSIPDSFAIVAETLLAMFKRLLEKGYGAFIQAWDQWWSKSQGELGTGKDPGLADIYQEIRKKTEEAILQKNKELNLKAGQQSEQELGYTVKSTKNFFEGGALIANDFMEGFKKNMKENVAILGESIATETKTFLGFSKGEEVFGKNEPAKLGPSDLQFYIDAMTKAKTFGGNKAEIESFAKTAVDYFAKYGQTHPALKSILGTSATSSKALATNVAKSLAESTTGVGGVSPNIAASMPGSPQWVEKYGAEQSESAKQTAENTAETSENVSSGLSTNQNVLNNLIGEVKNFTRDRPGGFLGFNMESLLNDQINLQRKQIQFAEEEINRKRNDQRGGPKSIRLQIETTDDLLNVLLDKARARAKLEGGDCSCC